MKPQAPTILIAFVVLLVVGFFVKMFFYMALIIGFLKLLLLGWIGYKYKYKTKKTLTWEEEYILRKPKGVIKYHW
jgi:hypothetical protein